MKNILGNEENLAFRDYHAIQDKYYAIRSVIPDMLLHIAESGTIKDCIIPQGFLTGIAIDNPSGRDIFEVFPFPLATKYMRHVRRALRVRKQQAFEYCITTGNEPQYREVRVLAHENGKEVIALIRDITERRQMEIRLREMTMRDSLTGLYNRGYFEEEIQRLEDGRYLPIGIIVCDVDGLKLINDSLGHITGDVHLKIVAGILQKCFRKSDVVARIGGDEFAVILRNCNKEVLEQSCQRIKQLIEKHYATEQAIPLALSLGFAFADRKGLPLAEVFQEADNNMYREKLYSSQSTRSAIVEVVMRLLEARDFVTEGHVVRMEQLLVRFGNYMQLSSGILSDLRLLAKIHDIGKVGIADRVLFKPGPLTEEEYQEVKRHCEIGHRIAKASTDLCRVAELVLKHHERWDGSGYPLGLKGKQIPFECRMLAIADAFDAMTNNRPYRKAMPVATALLELKKCAGSQFDPEFVQKFTRMMEEDIEVQFSAEGC